MLDAWFCCWGGRMQDIGTAKPNTRGAMYAGFRLKSGVWGMAKIN